jgi:hypothetical protein
LASFLLLCEGGFLILQCKVHRRSCVISELAFPSLSGLQKSFGVFLLELLRRTGQVCLDRRLVLAIRKDLVDMKDAETGFVGSFDDKMMGLMYSQGIKAISKNGVLGDPLKAKAGQGEEYLERWAEKMVDFVRKQVDI